jgi:hypothetical protein
MQGAAQKCHVAVGWNDVDAIHLHHHAVVYLHHFHAGGPLDQLSQQALVVRRQVLHQYKRHAGCFVGR